MILRNKGRVLVLWFSRITRLVINASIAKRKSVIWFYADHVLSLYKKSGSIKFLVTYLKVAQLVLMQSLGGQIIRDTTEFGCRISRTKSGIPRLIPRLCRKKIRKGDLKEIRLWLTLFSLYRVLEFPGKLKLQTITKPSIAIQNWDLIQNFLERWITFISWFHSNNARSKVGGEWPDFSKSSIGKYIRYGFKLTDLDSERCTPWAEKSLIAKPFVIKKAGPCRPGASTNPVNILMSAWLWFRKDLTAWASMTDWLRLTHNDELAMFMMLSNRTWPEVFKDLIPRKFDAFKRRWIEFKLEDTKKYFLGKLATKDEPAGKIRVFAIVDCWTQWMLNPLHKALQQVLRCIPQDGTFDQEAPVKKLIARLGPETACWSYDLSAATDRLPIQLQELLLGPILGPRLARAWKKILVERDYKLPPSAMMPGNPDNKVRYAAGQPMGALSSWVMLAFTHHFIVQYAAWRVGYKTWFTDYAVLGDDIVIARDNLVASMYYQIMTGELGVEINKSKSLITKLKNKAIEMKFNQFKLERRALASKGLTLEFAKRFYYRGQDCSALSFKELMESNLNWNILVERKSKSGLSLASILVANGFDPKSLKHLTRYLPDMNPGLRWRVMIANHPSKSSLRWEDYLGLPKDPLLYRSVALNRVRKLLERLATMIERAESLTELGKVLDIHNLKLPNIRSLGSDEASGKTKAPILVAKAPRIMSDLLIHGFLRLWNAGTSFVMPSYAWPEFAASVLYGPAYAGSELKLHVLRRRVEILLGVARGVDWKVLDQFHDFMVSIDELDQEISAITVDFEIDRKEDDNPRPFYFRSVEKLYQDLGFSEQWTIDKSVWSELDLYSTNWWD